MEKDRELVIRAKQGDVQAFADLYEGIYRDLYRFAVYTLRNEADAEDTVSETVTDAFASIHRLRDEHAFRGWMFGILSNKCKVRIREYTRKSISLEDAEGEMKVAEDLTEQLHIRHLFRRLSEEERLIISLHVFGGYTSREIGSLLKMNANTVRTKESRALKKLAQDYDNDTGVKGSGGQH